MQVRRATNLCIEKDEKKRNEIETLRKTTIQQSFAVPATNGPKAVKDKAGTDEGDTDSGERVGEKSGGLTGAVEEVDATKDEVDEREGDIPEFTD